MHTFKNSQRRGQSETAVAGDCFRAPPVSRLVARSGSPLAEGAAAGAAAGFGKVLAMVCALAFALGASLAVPAAYAVHPLEILEDSLELKPADTRWPETAQGAVVLPGCTVCKQDRYTLRASARFLVGQQPVAYREFLATVRGGRASAVFIAIERATGEVSRATVMP